MNAVYVKAISLQLVSALPISRLLINSTACFLQSMLTMLATVDIQQA